MMIPGVRGIDNSIDISSVTVKGGHYVIEITKRGVLKKEESGETRYPVVIKVTLLNFGNLINALFRFKK